MKRMRSNTSVITNTNELNDPFLMKGFILCQKRKFDQTLFTVIIPKTKWCAKIKSKMI